MENDKHIVDTDKLVSRLLDIIEKQIGHTPREQHPAPPPVETLKIDKGFSEQKEKQIRVVSESPPELASEALNPLPSLEAPVASTSKSNALFICIFAALAFAVILISLRSTPEEVAQVNKKMAKEELQFQGQITNQESLIRGRDSDIDALERKLAATEKALSENEVALKETQTALRELQPESREGATGAVNSRPPILTESQQVEQKRRSIVSIRAEYSNALLALGANKEALIQIRTDLATNRLKLQQIDLAINDLKTGATVEPSNKSIDDFLPKGGASVDLGDPLERIPATELDSPLPTDLASLTELAENETAALAHVIRKLKLYQTEILDDQRYSLSVQDLLREHQKTLETLAHDPRVLAGGKK